MKKLLENPEFIVKADIDGKLSDFSFTKRTNYLSRYSDEILTQFRLKLNREIAGWILGICSAIGVIPAHILPVFSVAKKGSAQNEPFYIFWVYAWTAIAVLPQIN